MKTIGEKDKACSSNYSSKHHLCPGSDPWSSAQAGLNLCTRKTDISAVSGVEVPPPGFFFFLKHTKRPRSSLLLPFPFFKCFWQQVFRRSLLAPLRRWGCPCRHQRPAALRTGHCRDFCPRTLPSKSRLDPETVMDCVFSNSNRSMDQEQ